MIATDRLKATITSNALTFLRETFLNARVKTPNIFTGLNMIDLTQHPSEAKKEFFRIIPKFNQNQHTAKKLTLKTSKFFPVPNKKLKLPVNMQTLAK